VLMSLLSRPALGNDIACTPSILASIEAGTSLHGGLDCQDQVGCSADYWYSAGAEAWQRISSLTGGSITPESQFGAIFGCGPWPIAPEDLSPVLSVLLYDSGSDIQIQAAKQSVAALLNAIILNATSLGYIFGPTADDIVAGYCREFGINDLAWLTSCQALNTRSCPLNNDPDNFFYQPLGA